MCSILLFRFSLETLIRALTFSWLFILIRSMLPSPIPTLFESRYQILIILRFSFREEKFGEWAKLYYLTANLIKAVVIQIVYKHILFVLGNLSRISESLSTFVFGAKILVS